MRLRFPKSFLVRDLRGFRLVNVVHRDEVIRQKRLQALQIVTGIGPFRLRASNALFGRRHVGFGAVDVGFGDRNRALERCNLSLFVGDLPFQSGLLRQGPFQRVLIRPVVNFEEQFALFYELVVVDRQSDQRPLDLRRNSNVVRQHGRIIGPGMVGRLMEHNQTQHGGDRHNANADPAPNQLLRIRIRFSTHNICSFLN